MILSKLWVALKLRGSLHTYGSILQKPILYPFFSPLTTQPFWLLTFLCNFKSEAKTEWSYSDCAKRIQVPYLTHRIGTTQSTHCQVTLTMSHQHYFSRKTNNRDGRFSISIFSQWPKVPVSTSLVLNIYCTVDICIQQGPRKKPINFMLTTKKLRYWKNSIHFIYQKDFIMEYKYFHKERVHTRLNMDRLHITPDFRKTNILPLY